MPFRISLPLGATSLMFVHTILTGNKFNKKQAYLKQVSFDVPLKYTYYFNKGICTIRGSVDNYIFKIHRNYFPLYVTKWRWIF
jgi:hypothetical protein